MPVSPVTSTGASGAAGERDLLVDREHAAAAADEPVGSRAARGKERPRAALAARARRRERARHHLAHLADVDGLADVVERPGLHGLERRLERPEGADQHHLDLRVARLERAQQVEAVLVGVQVDVGDHEVEAALGRAARAPPLRRLGHLDLALRLAQQLVHEAAGLGIVVHDQDPRHQAHPSPPAGTRARSCPRPAGSRGEPCRRAPRPPRAGSAARGPCPSRAASWCRADRRPWRAPRPGCRGPSPPPAARRPTRGAAPRACSAPAAGHRVDGVADEVQERLLELRTVGADRGQARRHLERELDPASDERGAHQLGEPGHELAGRERPQAQGGPPRPVEQRLDDRGDAGDLLLDRGEARGVGRSRGLLRLQQLDVARDHVERRADLVRDRGRHLPRERQALALGELAAGVEQALRGREQRAVRVAQLLGRARDLALQRLVEAAHALEQAVQPLGHGPDLVLAHARRARGQVALGGVRHRVEHRRERLVHEAARQPVEAQREQNDRHRREHEGRLPALVLHAPQRVHPHRDHHRAVALVLPLERHRHEVQAQRSVGEADRLVLRDRPLAEPQRRGRRGGVGAGDDRRGARRGDRDRADRRHRLAVVGEQVHELRGRGRLRVLAEVGRDAEGDRGRGVRRLGFDGPRHDARLEVGAEADHRRDHQRSRDAESCAERNHVSQRYPGRTALGQAAPGVAVWRRRPRPASPGSRRLVDNDLQRAGPSAELARPVPHSLGIMVRRLLGVAPFWACRGPDAAGGRRHGPGSGSAAAGLEPQEPAHGDRDRHDGRVRSRHAPADRVERERVGRLPPGGDARVWLGNNRLPGRAS